MLFDRQGRCLTSNRPGLTMMKISDDEIQGREFRDIWPEEMRPEIDQHVAEVLEGQPCSFDAFRMNGPEKGYWHVILNPITGHDGTIGSFVAISTDITDRKVMEDALRKSESRFRAVIEQAGDGFELLDEDGRYCNVNKSTCNQLGYTRDEILAMTVCDVDPNLSREKYAAHFRSLIDRGPAVFETLHTRKDGTTFPVEITTSVVHLGEELRALAFVRDITERKAAEVAILKAYGELELRVAERTAELEVSNRELEREILEHKRAEEVLGLSETRYRMLYEGTPVMMHSIDRSGRLVSVSDHWLRTLGYRRDEVIGRYSTEFLTEQSRTYAREVVLPGFMHSGVCDNIEYQFVKKSREIIDVLLSAIAERDEAGEVQRSLAVIIDITERKRAEEELKRHRDQLEEMVARRTAELAILNDQLRQSQKLEAVGLLAGGIAHDFGNILTTIKGSVYLINKHDARNTMLTRYTEQILSSVERANDLTKSLLSFSRRQSIALQPLELNDLIRDAAQILIKLIGEHVKLKLDLVESCTTIMAGRNQLDQILVNLAVNARDAMPDGGQLTFGTEIMEMDDLFRSAHGYGTPGKYVLLSVSDSGTGIHEGIRGKIFEPFFTTKDFGKGSGLGLAVTYGIVKQHGGYIDVEPSSPGGTTFRIYLPFVEIAPVTPDAHLHVSAFPGRGETILLAEDDRDVRETVAEVLRVSGYKVIEARDGVEAMGLFAERSGSIDLAMLDVRMPVKSGREVYDEIMRQKPGTKVLFISGYNKDIMDSAGTEDGSLNFLSKSASPDEILLKLREVLDRE